MCAKKIYTDSNLRYLRLLYRIPWLLLHLLIGLPLTLITFNALGRKIPTWSPYAGRRRLDETMTCWWSGVLCRIFGLHRRVNRTFAQGPQLVVSNHLSWLDIQLLHSYQAMGFIGKAEIREWFLLGFVATAGGTVFHRRGSHDSSSSVVAAMNKRLASGGKVAIFAEGGVLPGAGVKRFHARLFAAAIESGVEVQPVMLRYLRDGSHYEAITFLPGENMFTNLFRLLSQKACVAEVELLAPFSVRGMQRKEVASQAQQAVVEAYERFEPREPAAREEG